MTAAGTQDERHHRHGATGAALAMALALVALTAACGANTRGAVAGTTAPPGSGAAATTNPASATSDPPTTIDPGAATAGTTSTTATTSVTQTTVDPGTLPQTKDRPSGTDPAFTAAMALLWQAVTTNQPSLAHSAFFPLTAYRQVKAVQYPDGDYQTRLLAHFDDDIRSLHTKLGAAAAGASLLGVVVPDSQATWVLPGTEYNKGSYWRVYGAVLRYGAGGHEMTYPIGSLISWRGRWYVVHLGAIR